MMVRIVITRVIMFRLVMARILMAWIMRIIAAGMMLGGRIHNHYRRIIMVAAVVAGIIGVSRGI